MKPISNVRKIFTWFHMCAIDEDASKKEKIIRILIPIAILSTIAFHVIASTVFVRLNLKMNLEASLSACIHVDWFICLIYMLCIGLLMRHKVNAIFVDLEKFYEKNANEASYKYLLLTNGTCENISRIYFKHVPVIASGSVIVSSLLSITLCWLKSDFTNLLHPNHTVLPWDTNTPLGYLLETVFSAAMELIYVYVNGAFLLLFVSLCRHHRAIYKMFRHSVNELDQPARKGNPAQALCNIIRFHNSAKILFMQWKNIFEPLLMVVLFCSMLYIAVDIFLIDRQIGQPNSDLFLLIFIAFCGQSNLFVYCFFGKMASESYMGMSECLYNSNWSRLPIHLQKYVLLMIQNTQRPLHYDGFGIVILNLGTFAKLTKNLFSYYMMFKRISA